VLKRIGGERWLWFADDPRIDDRETKGSGLLGASPAHARTASPARMDDTRRIRPSADGDCYGYAPGIERSRTYADA
jgi:hypothetical protein